MKAPKLLWKSLLSLALIAFAATAYGQSAQNDTALKIKTIEIEAGAEKEFSVLHISDSHLALADERNDERKMKLSAKRTKIFGNSQSAIEAQRNFAKENNLIIIHTGDLIDFVSEANIECAARIFSDGEWIVCAGNHEYSLYVGEAREDAAYRAQSYDKLQRVYPNDLTFYSRIVNGVNFVTLDNGYYKFSKEQFAKMKAEVKRGLPIVMVCHNPLYTPELCDYSLKKSKGKAAYLVGVPRKITDTYAHKPQPKGEEWRNRTVQQRTDKTTMRFVKWLKKQEELKAILCGHCHYNYKTQFSPTAVQYITGAGYKGYAQIVKIK